MISRPTHEQVVALCAIFQSCKLVDQLARTGKAPAAELKTCMDALLNQNPDSVDQLYGGIENLEMGAESLLEHLRDKRTDADSNVLRYVLSILHLAQRLKNNSEMTDRVAKGIEQANRQAQHFNVTHDNVFANVAGLYQHTISTFRFRIQVNGVANYLQQSNIANRIRCMLFSAIRSAFLWRQLGGKRYHLLLHRKRIAALVKSD